MITRTNLVGFIGVLSLTIFAGTLWADPCGMVPPITTGNQVPIARVGDQQTYVFYKDGVETFVIRPGFQGNTEEFGMLIPFPSVPSIRKVPDNVFPHIAASIDPPEVVVDLRIQLLRGRNRFANGVVTRSLSESAPLALQRDEVRVVKEEAVGMYEVAVLEAGSPRALQKWMDEHGYKYPDGMDLACQDYVDEGWCFVAVKTKVAAKSGVDPKPGMRKADDNFPKGATFDGHVQAMGFRFEVDHPVVPMRLSTFNEGDLHNIVYFLTDGPQKIRSIPEEYVVRQISGEQLRKHVTEPLPLRIIGGTAKQIPEWQRKTLPQQRDPKPHNSAARDLFASDLLAVKEDRLAHPHEEHEKMLLRIGERLGLRGPEIDALNATALQDARDETAETNLAALEGMTLTVVDGDFPREVLAEQNLTFTEYEMSPRRNSPEHYNAIQKGPAGKQPGAIHYGEISAIAPAGDEDSPQALADRSNDSRWWSFPVLAGMTVGAVLFMRRRRR